MAQSNKRPASNMSTKTEEVEKGEQSETINNNGFDTPPRQVRTSDNLSLYPDAAWEKIKTDQIFADVPTVKTEDSKWNTGDDCDCTRIVCMSDTHGKHREVFVPKGDILLHGGDFTSTGQIEMVQDLCEYFQELAFPTTICIAGNHDLTMDAPYYKRNWNRFHSAPKDASKSRQCLMDLMKKNQQDKANKFYYLEDESCAVPTAQTQKENVDSAPISVYGSPWSPEFYDWAFNVPRGQPSWEIWSRIPDTTDVLICHGPPLGRGDLCAHGGRAGCYDLLDHVQQRVQPRLHVFGHIHEGYGSSYDGKTLYVNASNLDLEYEAVHPCVVVDLPYDPNQSARVVRPSCSLTWDELPRWFQYEGYSTLANTTSKWNESQYSMLPSKDTLLETTDAYEQICALLDPEIDLPKAKRELWRALSQIYAESF